MLTRHAKRDDCLERKKRIALVWQNDLNSVPVPRMLLLVVLH